MTTCFTRLLFDDATGWTIDIEWSDGHEHPDVTEPRTGPGRPKLGVVSREVSLLPRHWDWLNAQPAGASAAIRRLVDEARKRSGAAEHLRNAKDALYRFMSVTDSDLPGFQEAARVLYRDQHEQILPLIREEQWPADLQAHIARQANVLLGLQQQAPGEQSA